MARIKFLSSNGSEFILEFNTAQLVPNVAKINCYSQYGNKDHVIETYSAPVGYVIIESEKIFVEVSRWGRNSYTDRFENWANNTDEVQDFQTISTSLEALRQLDKDNNQAKLQDELSWLLKFFNDTYSTISSLKDHYIVTANTESYCKFDSGIVGCVDWATGNIEGSFTFKILKLISDSELRALNTFMNLCITNGETVTHTFE